MHGFDCPDLTRQFFGSRGSGNNHRIAALNFCNIFRRGMVFVIMGDQDQIGLGPIRRLNGNLLNLIGSIQPAPHITMLPVEFFQELHEFRL
jgi:hypothetical protein